jgi:hypothetical protein
LIFEDFNLKTKDMKKYLLILVMLLMAATSFTQPSRRTTNNTKPAGQERRTNINDNKKPNQDAKKSSVRSQDRKSPKQPGTTETRPDTRNAGQPGNRPGNKPDDRSDNRPGDQPRREYKSTSPQQPVKDDARRPDVDKNDRRRPGNYQQEGPGGVTTNRPPENVDRTAKGHVVPQGPNRPEQPKERPVYHSTRQFVQPRPVRHHYVRPPRPREYRAQIYPYRRPHDIHIIWSPDMRLEYLRIYPEVKRWNYAVGYTIPTISAYDALYYEGEVMNVYGKVYEVYYSAVTDEYFLYFGAYYPYHDFTVVLPGWIARGYSAYPESYFEREHVIVTGLISTFDDKPELVVKRENQLSLY